MGNHPNTYGIPPYMTEGIHRYIYEGIKPGGFLSAVIENNLIQAVSHADDENIKLIPQYVSYFYNEAPSACWGNRYNVDTWIEMGGLNVRNSSL